MFVLFRFILSSCLSLKTEHDVLMICLNFPLLFRCEGMSEEHIVRYQHGGTLVREGMPQYNGRKIDAFGVDPDKLCYWDLLGDLQVLGYNVSATIDLFFVDDSGTLKQISYDTGLGASLNTFTSTL